MLNIGELYHYDSLLNQSNPANLQASIYGVDFSEHTTNLDGEKLVKLKNHFIDSYSHELKESNLNKAHDLWIAITSVLTKHGDTDELDELNTTGQLEIIQQEVSAWLKKGQDLDELEKMLNDFEVISSSLESYSLYYGLRVLWYISSRFREKSKNQIVVDSFYEELEKQDFKKMDEMVALTIPSLYPLFKASSIETCAYLGNSQEAINRLEAMVHAKEDLKVVLCLGIDEETVQKIQKHFQNKLLVCVIPEAMSQNQNGTNFFAELGLKTIGLSEAVIKNEIKTPN
jgi:hypothetical protein